MTTPITTNSCNFVFKMMQFFVFKSERLKKLKVKIYENCKFTSCLYRCETFSLKDRRIDTDSGYLRIRYKKNIFGTKTFEIS